jgi:phosphoribosylformimino-5-aminoimidazole carboxamide ribotide isomerase
MIPIPAIDLKGGKVVRLLQGNFKEEKIYPEKPAEVAARYEIEGAGRLHVVDLDGALKGAPKNEDSLEEILKTVRIPLQVGGGIRDLKTVQRYLDLGAAWVILGTQACLDRGFVKEAIREFGAQIILGIDARDGLIATDGWTKVTAVRAVDFAKEAEALGIQTVVYTDISTDGMLKGPNLEGICAMAGILTVSLIASGGVSKGSDLTALRDLGLPNLVGVIIGKALYEGRLSLKEAIRACSPKG